MLSTYRMHSTYKTRIPLRICCVRVMAGFLPRAATSLCADIGAKTLSVEGIACGVVIVGAGSYIAGKTGEWVGNYLGELIYKKANDTHGAYRIYCRHYNSIGRICRNLHYTID